MAGAATRAVVGSFPLGGLALGGFDVAGMALGGRGKRGGGRPGFFSVGKRGVVGLTRKDGTTRTIRVGTVAHIGKNLPGHRQITRLRRNLSRHRADVLTLAKVMGLNLGRGGQRRKWQGYKRRKYGGKRR